MKISLSKIRMIGASLRFIQNDAQRATVANQLCGVMDLDGGRANVLRNQANVPLRIGSTVH